MQKKIARLSLFRSAQANREQARKLRQAAQKARASADRTMARARRLRLRVDQLNSKVQNANTEIQHQTTLRDDALDALKQSLQDLESIRLVLAADKKLDRLKAEIRKTIRRAR